MGGPRSCRWTTSLLPLTNKVRSIHHVHIGILRRVLGGRVSEDRIALKPVQPLNDAQWRRPTADPATCGHKKWPQFLSISRALLASNAFACYRAEQTIVRKHFIRVTGEIPSFNIIPNVKKKKQQNETNKICVLIEIQFWGPQYTYIQVVDRWQLPSIDNKRYFPIFPVLLNWLVINDQKLPNLVWPTLYIYRLRYLQLGARHVVS
jgi:hypothetical protein